MYLIDTAAVMSVRHRAPRKADAAPLARCTGLPHEVRCISPLSRRICPRHKPYEYAHRLAAHRLAQP